MLLAAFLHILSAWRTVFPQQRTYQRAVQHGLGSLACLGRRCLSRIIWTRPGAPARLVSMAVDDTRLRNTGRSIPQAS